MEQTILSEFNLDLATATIPQYIAIEGPIGIGKTTLAKRLAHSFNYEILLEDAEENPFLERFYQDRRSNALPTQLFFLFQRMRKLQDIPGRLFSYLDRQNTTLFDPVRIAYRCVMLPRARCVTPPVGWTETQHRHPLTMSIAQTTSRDVYRWM